MQEIFDGILQRINLIFELRNSLQHSAVRIASGENLKESSIYHQLITLMVHMRREERKRIVKETELVDLIHSFKDYEEMDLR